MRGLAVAVLTICAAGFSDQAKELPPVLWRLDSVESIAGHPVTRFGSPQVVQTDRGPAVAFNGKTDGLFLDVNPLQGLSQFTVEVLFSPDVDGQEEQRFLHFQEATSENRALIELRQQKGGQWFLDTYLRYNEAQSTLQDRTLTHPAGDWHVATLTFDGKTMAHFVDGKRELNADVAFRPLAAGRTSIGVRQTQISWFKGRIHTVRVTPRVLLPEQFLTVPPREIALWPEGQGPTRAANSGTLGVLGRHLHLWHPRQIRHLRHPKTPAVQGAGGTIAATSALYHSP